MHLEFDTHNLVSIKISKYVSYIPSSFEWECCLLLFIWSLPRVNSFAVFGHNEFKNVLFILINKSPILLYIAHGILKLFLQFQERLEHTGDYFYCFLIQPNLYFTTTCDQLPKLMIAQLYPSDWIIVTQIL